MQQTVKQRVIWIALGFLLGVLVTIGYAALSLWPFQDYIFLHWVRWMGKETLKWSFIAVVFVIVAFIVTQIMNLIFLLRQERQNHTSDSAPPV